MPVHDLFSYRKRLAASDMPDVYVYEALPRELLVQIVHIWRDAIGPYYVFHGYETSHVRQNNQGWELIHDVVAREHGVFELARGREVGKRCENYLLESPSVDAALDLIEVSFRYVDKGARRFDPREQKLRGIRMTAEDAIEELNERFRRAGVGYQFEDGRIFRVDSVLIHSEVVRPALRYLHQKGFEGPCDEFLQAHAHYRAGETKDAITDANNALYADNCFMPTVRPKSLTDWVAPVGLSA